MKSITYFSFVLFCTIHFGVQAQSLKIKNDIFWDTADQRAIYSQGGGIFKFIDPQSKQQKYYWYGVQYAEASLYRQNPTIKYDNATFESVYCYSSLDLVNWTSERSVLTKEELAHYGGKTWVGRLGVAYLKEIKKYAMFVQHGNKVLITVANSPIEEFKWYQEIDMKPLIGTSNTGDQTVFTDEDTGKSYLIYSYGRGRNKIYVSEIGVREGKIGLLDCTQVFKGESREGNCMFKYQGKYYMCASNIYGWDASYAYFLMADNIHGPYKPINNMQVMEGCENDFAHVTQTGFFVSVKGTKKETILYCGDRWADFAGNGLGYNQWLPLSFNGKKPYFNSLSAWYLNEKTGDWYIAEDNNYAINGSFEADRNRIPSAVKPVQEQLTGWITQIIEGNKISTSDVNSPTLNYFNSEKDRKSVIGEKSLQISDDVKFKRKVSQQISSVSSLPLPDGSYILSAKIKNSKGFTLLKMYATSNNYLSEQVVNQENENWTTIQIKKIAVKEGKIEIGIIAEGLAGAVCLLDDVSLLKEN
ncbi:family 43 glycosylhydrolase [Pedobacter sp. MW01-1-1]|uniref:family 43 glycosylhydrolase n=1 Tax=Pedobacter sp. MW01-1-1 TaxID=3383027 RepID=UPI003FF091C8